MEEILINNMYNENQKSYANEGKNIVHEIINLFKAENGKHYIYILGDGTIAAEHNDKISNIFLTRSVGNKTAEIVALVKKPIQLAKKDSKLSKEENRIALYKKQEEYIDKIMYDKKRKIKIDEIFKNNTYHKKQEKNVIYATFEAEIVLKPKEPLFLTYEKENKKHPNTYILNKHFINQSQTAFIKENEDDYKILENLLESDKWEDSFEKIDIDKYLENKRNEEDHYNFLKLIHHEYYEPAFSNLFQHYFKQNPKIFKEFAKEVLGGIDIDINSKEFEIKREENNIDILIRDDTNIIVIENKIKSGINGKKYDDYGEEIQNQLVKYYDYVTENIDETKITEDNPHYYDKNRKPHFFIFAPNYKHLDTSKFEKAKIYKTVNYSEIYNFYNKYIKESDEYFDKYFKDFVNSLYKHTLSVDSDLYDTMLERFVKAIQNSKNT